VLDQPRAQAARFHAHQRVGGRIEIRGLAEHGDGNRVATDPARPARERLFRDVTEKRRPAPSPRERGARQNALQLGANFFGGR
jgi:hypothetical protein